MPSLAFFLLRYPGGRTSADRGGNVFNVFFGKPEWPIPDGSDIREPKERGRSFRHRASRQTMQSRDRVLGFAGQQCGNQFERFESTTTHSSKINGTPYWIRTSDLRIRNPLLYPAELRAPFFWGRQSRRSFPAAQVCDGTHTFCNWRLRLERRAKKAPATKPHMASRLSVTVLIRKPKSGVSLSGGKRICRSAPKKTFGGFDFLR